MPFSLTDCLSLGFQIVLFFLVFIFFLISYNCETVLSTQLIPNRCSVYKPCETDQKVFSKSKSVFQIKTLGKKRKRKKEEKL